MGPAENFLSGFQFKKLVHASTLAHLVRVTHIFVVSIQSNAFLVDIHYIHCVILGQIYHV